MELKVTTYKYVKEKVEDTIFNVPEETIYCFQTGIRRAVRIIPLRWEYEDNNFNKRGDIYQLNVTCIYGSFECKIENFNVSINERDISEMITVNDDSRRRDQQSIVHMLLNKDYHVRTKEQWEADWNGVMNKIEEHK